MRELNCAHVLTAADAPAATARTIRIDGESIAAVDAARPGAAQLSCAMPPLPMPTTTPAPCGQLTWSFRQAAGDLAALSGAGAVDRSLSAAAVSLARSALGGPAS
jgi:hypothetical protein